MRYQKWGKTGQKLVCYSKQKSKPYLVKDPDCDNENVWADEVEKEVINCLFSFKFDMGKKKKENTESDALAMLNEQYNICSHKIKTLYNLSATSEDELLLETIDANKSDLQKLREQIKREQDKRVKSDKYTGIHSQVENLSELWQYMTIQEQQNIVRTLVKRIEVGEGQTKIVLSY
jgi:site-specific DNA recombinase